MFLFTGMMRMLKHQNCVGAGGAAAVTGSQLPVTGQIVSYTPAYLAAGDDGKHQAGKAHDYTANTTGQYSGTTAITLNGKTDTKSNETVTDGVTNLMWSRDPSYTLGPDSNGRLFWDDHTDIVEAATYRWTLSASGTNEYYLELAAGGNPGLASHSDVVEDADSASGDYMTSGTLGALAAGEWAYGDNDTLGFSTFYVRLTDSVDPDTKADGFLKITNRETIFHYVQAANDASFAGHTDWRAPNQIELLSIMDNGGANSKPDATAFDNFTQALSWSSNTRTNSTTNKVYMYWDNTQMSVVGVSNKYSAMLVRNAS